MGQNIYLPNFLYISSSSFSENERDDLQSSGIAMRYLNVEVGEQSDDWRPAGHET